MSITVDKTIELNKVVEEYIGSNDSNKHKKYARVICFILTYLHGTRTYGSFLGENKLNKDGNPGSKVGSGFMRLIESHKKQSKSDSLYIIRREVMDCFHNVELCYVRNSAQLDIADILVGFKKLNIPIEQSVHIKNSSLGGLDGKLITMTYNALIAANINSIGDLFENYGGEWRLRISKLRNIGTGAIGLIDKIIEDTGLDIHMSSEEYKLLKKLSSI